MSDTLASIEEAWRQAQAHWLRQQQQLRAPPVPPRPPPAPPPLPQGRQKKRKKVPPPVAAVELEPLVELEPIDIPAGTRPATPLSPTAMIVHGGSASLRAQFVLSEVLKPPLSLREPRW